MTNDIITLDQRTCLASHRSDRFAFVGVWVTFLFFSLVHAPIPGTNEAHYLCKALHFWQPAWCNRDFFLTSSNPHWLFYLSVGWFEGWMSFAATALTGRLIGYGLLAWGWVQLATVLGLRNWEVVVAAWLLLFLNSLINLSGEWLVGGIESKVLAYAFVFAGLAAYLEDRRLHAAWQLGVAVAFHPLVGLWSILAGMCATGACRLSGVPPLGSQCHLSTPLPGSRVADGPEPRQTSISQLKRILPIPLFVSTASVGILPAVSVIGGETPQQIFEANYIQVFYRLAHHLDPMQFSAASYVSYVAMFLLACWLSRRLISTPASIWFRWFVTAAALIAFTGWLLGLGPRPPLPATMPMLALRTALLKFYPFRLADAFVPLFLAISIVQSASDGLQWVRQSDRWQRRFIALAAVLLGLAVWQAAGVGSVRYLPDDRKRDWLEVCHWARRNSPPDAQFVTPRESWNFKWYAERAEYVAFKDCPQDVSGIIEWNRRLRWLREWAAGFNRDVFAESGVAYTAEQVKRLHEHTQAEYFISHQRSPLDAPVVFSNATYIVYRID